jgi:putative exporter of polyketide antibiotics
MNASEKPSPPGTPPISSEAIVGIGITIAVLGVLCLLLGLAEYMRSVPAIAWIWLALGAVLFVLGGLTAAFAWSKDRRR